jgi:hypothetical protein
MSKTEAEGDKSMAAAVKAAREWEWAADALEFAAQQRVQEHLEPLREATRRIFPTAQSLRVVVDEDPEIRNYRHMVFEVQVVGLSLNEIHQARKEWKREQFDRCPAPLLCAFCLSLDLA